MENLNIQSLSEKISQAKQLPNVLAQGKQLQIQSAQPATQSLPSEPEIGPETIDKIVGTLNGLMNPLSMDFQVNYIDSLNQYQVKIVNTDTNEVMKEFPYTRLIELREKLSEMQLNIFK